MATPFPFTAGQVLTAAQMNAITELVINDKTDSYTLVAGDAGERVVMNKATSSTITVPNSVFTAGQVVYIANKGAGVCTVTAGAGVTVNVSGSLALSQYGGGTLLALSASSFIFFPAGGIGYGTATGGTAISPDPVIDGVTYRVLQFTATGTLTVTKAGLFDVLLVGSGGAGAAFSSGYGGGGGGGGVDIATIYLSANATVTVGGGAAYGARIGTSSRLGTKPDSIVVAGGGSGGGTNYAGDRALAFGGASGGGGMGTGNATFILGAVGIDGGDGGNGQQTDNQAGGGGGGNTANGTNGSGTVGGNGGAGYDASTFRGESAGTTRYGGGGGGGGASGGTGGVGGGGNRGSAGSVNTGGGGGGASSAGGTGYAGGSGIVLVRFKV